MKMLFPVQSLESLFPVKALVISRLYNARVTLSLPHYASAGKNDLANIHISIMFFILTGIKP